MYLSCIQNPKGKVGHFLCTQVLKSIKQSDSRRKDQNCNNTFYFTSVLLGAVREVLQPPSGEADSVVGTDYSQLVKDSGKNERDKHLLVPVRVEKNRIQGWAPQCPVHFNHI